MLVESQLNDELKGKKLLILGGMQISKEIVRKAQEMGVFVAVTDYNPVEKSPAKQMADQHFMISTTDVNAIVQLVEQEQFDGVLTGFVDLLLPYYAEICHIAGLPALASKEQYEVFIEKRKYKALLKEYDIPVPEEYLVTELSQDQLDSIKYPVIVKPADSSGARGIRVCNSWKELGEASKVAAEVSKSKTVVVEEYLTGEEVTAFWMMQDGEPFFLGLANRHVENNQGSGVIGLPVGYTIPSIYTNSYMDCIVPKMQDFLINTQIRNGLLFLQCIVDKGVPKVYDLGLRLTGSLEYYIFSKACNFNPLEMIIRFSLLGNEGASIRDKVNPFLQGRYGWNISFLMKPGKIQQINGFDAIKQVPGVIEAVLAHEVGDETYESERGLLKQICCRVLGLSDSINTMKEAIQRVTLQFDVLDTAGESLLLPVLDIENYMDSLL